MTTNHHDYYNTDHFPTLIAHNGPWDIYRNAEGKCAAIPVTPQSGHAASHFGDVSHVLRVGLQLLTPAHTA